jgi:hypothetical protein
MSEEIRAAFLAGYERGARDWVGEERAAMPAVILEAERRYDLWRHLAAASPARTEPGDARRD